MLFSGTEVLGQHLLTYLGFLVLAPVAWWVLGSTGLGMRLHAVGENFEAADVAGISVARTQYVALMVGGALMAIGGPSSPRRAGQLHPRHRQRPGLRASRWSSSPAGGCGPPSSAR